jgi:PAS domain S-box-containing protein
MLPVYGLIAVALIEVTLGLVLLAKAPHRPINRWFSAFAGAVALWGLFNAVFRLVADPPINLILSRASFAAAALIPAAFVRFAAVFPHPGPARRGWLQLVTLSGLFICGLAFSTWIVADLRLETHPYQPLYGPLHGIFALYFVLCYALALGHLGAKLRRAQGVGRVQLHYLLLGTALACLGAVTTNLIVPLLFGTSRYSAYGPYFTLIWVGFTAHAIVRHRLMDIRVVISRWLAYGVGWAVTTGILVGGVLVLSDVLLGHTVSPVADVLLGLAASVCFVMVAPHMKRLADRYLYRPAYDAGQLIGEGSRAMATFGNPQRVATVMAELIGKALAPESLAIVVWQAEREAFLPAYARHFDAAVAWPEPALSGKAALVRELRAAAGVLLSEDLSQRPPSREIAAIASDLHAWRAELALPVMGEDRLIAIVLLGRKRSGDPYFREDLDLLDVLASQLAIGLRNGQLYQEIVSIKEYNERILARMDSGVVAVRDDGIVTTFNPAAERITGIAAGTILGRPLRGLDPALQGIVRASLAGQPDSETEVFIAHPDGRTLPLITHTSALHDASGHVRGAIAVFNDHSRLKALEEDKRRTDRLAAMGALATGIAHEIRNPLVAIKTFAELLPERADDQEFKSTFAKVAAKEVHRIEELLSRLRALAVPTVSTLHPLDLGGPIADTLDLLRGEADRRHIRIISEVEPDLPVILGESDQLKQLFLNLFLNAFDAMATGGTLSVTIRADRPRRGGRARGDADGGGVLTVRVTDTGPGIPREDLHRIFEPFFTTKSQGTGLGLAICRGIADGHRARLWAEPGPAGVGTAFVAQFPTLAGIPAAAVR